MLQILNVLLWNACLAAGFAIAVFSAQRIWRLRCHPNLWHALWLLVLVKLVTPPIVTVPVFVGSTRTEQHQNDHLASEPSFESGALPSGGEADVTWLTKTMDAVLTPRFAVALSAIGTIALLLIGLSRIRSIGRLVQHAEPAPEWMREAAATAARQLELKRVPLIRTVGGTVAPFLWVTARGPIVVVPCQLVTALGPESVRLIIKHELSHYARRDHWANTFAMVLGSLFWWNPVVWWARRELRILQESCCDTMVLAPDSTQRHRYAEALLKTVDFVASDDAAFTSPATAFASCSTFKRRLEMIVAGTSNRSSSRWMQACVLLCALVVLPLGLAYGREPDYEAVGRRLGAAVKAGELTGEQARAMLGALRKADAKKDQEPDRARVDAHLWETWAKLQAAVKAGKMSEKDAHEKMGAIKREVFARLKGRGEREHGKGDRARVDAHLWETWAKLQAAVKAGRMSQEDAHRKMGEIKKDVFSKLGGRDERDHGKGDRAREYLMEVRRELGAAVEAGKISREDAAKKYEAAAKGIRERMAAGRRQTRTKHITKEDLARAGIEIRKAVAAGKITAEQGRAKMEAMRRMMGQPSERGAERGATRRPTRVDWGRIKDRIEGAVKRGDMTREEADAKYKEIRERTAGRRDR